MDLIAIQTIQGFLSVPLIAPENIHDLDTKEIAAALAHLDMEAAKARSEAEDVSWDEDQDEVLMERLQEIGVLVRNAIETCECGDEPCERCKGFSEWLDRS